MNLQSMDSMVPYGCHTMDEGEKSWLHENRLSDLKNHSSSNYPLTNYNYPVENENSTTRYAVDFGDVGTCPFGKPNSFPLGRNTLYRLRK